MKRFTQLTKFRNALDMGGLGEWSTDKLHENGIAGMNSPRVEYWDVVWRFIEQLHVFLEDHPDYMDEAKYPETGFILTRLNKAMLEEERIPGLLWGLLENGTIVRWLRLLEQADTNEE